MDELLAELERYRRGPARVRMAALGGIAIAATGIAVWSQLVAGAPDPCGDPAQALSDAWNDERRAAALAAFEAIELPYVARAWSLTSERLDGYAARWQQDFVEYCEATWKAGTQSGEALDPQMLCLADRRRDLAALTEVLVLANETIIESAPAAVAALPDLAQCGDVERLRQVGVPPDAETQRRVDEVRELVAAVRARIRT